MFEYLKALFGANEDGTPAALTFDQLEAKLTASKDVKLANLAEGGYVSKDKFDAKETELAGVKQQLVDANTSIKSYKDMDIDGIKKAASDWEQKYTADTTALNQKLADQERSHSLDMFLNGYKFSSKAAKDGIRAAIEAKKFSYEGGSFLGAKEYMDTLAGDDDYKGAFATEPAPAPAEPPANPHKPQFSDPKPQNQPKPTGKVPLVELMKMKNANPSAVIKYD